MDTIVQLNIDRIESSKNRVRSYTDHSSTKPSTKVSPEQVCPTMLKNIS